MPLAKKYRLTKDRDIKRVFSKGRTVKGGLFFIKFLPNDSEHARVTVTVSKKVSNKATVRNLIKRRFNAAMDQKHLLKNSVDIIVTVLPTILGKQFQEIKTETDKAINRVLGQL